MAQSNHRGRFVWYELMTTDPAAAQAFYTDVVGWGTAPFEGAPIPYTMWMKGETPVGGVFEIPAESGEGSIPPHWMGHVGVPDVDGTAERVKELGGRVIMGPDDVPNVGRFVVFADPQGAVIAAFKGLQEMSTEDANPQPGDVSWHELATTDHEGAFDFYSDLFGWEKQQAMDMGEAGVYQMYGRGDRMLGGMYNKSAGLPDPDKLKAEPGPPAWLYYFRVGDLDVAVRKVKAKGGKIVVEPMEVPGGSRIAVGFDPQGAAFGLHQSA
jgi:predicted enzyme related to lactoylglutathione lyase